MRSMNSDAVGEMGERVVERAVRELVLQRGEPEEPFVEAAAFDGEAARFASS